MDSVKKKVVTTPIAVKSRPLAKMTPEMKMQYDKSHIWDSVVSTLDKSPTKAPTCDVKEFIEPAVEKVTQREKIGQVSH